MDWIAQNWSWVVLLLGSHLTMLGMLARAQSKATATSRSRRPTRR